MGVTLCAVERRKSVSAGVLQQSVADGRIAGGFVDVRHIARCHVLVAARSRRAAISSTCAGGRFTRNAVHFACYAELIICYFISEDRLF